MDNLLNPFDSDDNVSFFLTLPTIDTEYNDSLINRPGDRQIQSAFGFKVSINLGPDLIISKRTRYSYWDLLGDVGGFHDGLFIVTSLFMGAYSQLAFKINFLDGSHIDSSSLSSNEKKVEPKA
jgi:hypothetical protein